MEDGTITRDKEELQAIWTTHWSQHFSSTCERGHSFDNIELEGFTQPYRRTEVLQEAVDAPAYGSTTPHEVRSVLAAFNVNRAAPDVCPHRYWKTMEPWLSSALSQEYNACLALGRIPDSWS
eukprot:6458845-Amphidinium_carterae.1